MSRHMPFILQHDDEDLHFVRKIANVKNEHGRSPRLLCLHGKGGNIEISKLQISRLALDRYFDVTFLEGPSPHFEAQEIQLGSEYTKLYSWTNRSEIDSGATSVNEIESLIKSLVMVLRHVEKFGPYEACYAFSQGATIASILSSEDLCAKIKSLSKLESTLRTPWNFVFLGWAANNPITKKMFEFFYHGEDCSYRINTTIVKINIPSIHYIGIADHLKCQSEEIACMYDAKQSMTLYFNAAHEVKFEESPEHESQILDAFNWFKAKALLDEKIITQSSRLVQMNVEIQQIAGCMSAVGSLGQYVLVDNRINPSTLNFMSMLQVARPDATIIINSDKSAHLTYGEVIDFMKTQGNLRRVGVQSKDRVAYVSPPGALSAVAFLTITAQCTSVPLDPTYTTQEFKLAFEQIKPKFVIVFTGVEEKMVTQAANLCKLTVIRAEYLAGTCGLFKFETDHYDSEEILTCADLEEEPNRDAIILRTSGTTSTPKLVPLKMHALVTNAYAIANSLGLKASDVSLNAMPLFHIGGIAANLLASIAAGGSVIMMPTFDVQEFYNLFTENIEAPRHACQSIKPTWYSAVPTMHAAIVSFVKSQLDIDGIVEFKHSLRFIRTGAAYMSQDLAEEIQEVFRCPVVPTYSMTELMPISQPPTHFRLVNEKPNSVGKPLVASLAIVGENLVPLEYEGKDGISQIGEICISGPSLFEQYESNPEANANSFFLFAGKRWFRTGDLGRVDREGFLFVTGRMKDMIKRGGEQISPLEVEEALDTHPVVKKSIVFPVPDALWGERVAAAIVLEDEFAKNGIYEELQIKKELKKYFSDVNSLVHPKFPEEIAFVSMDQIPKTKSGKYIRNGLSDLLGITERVLKEKNAKKPQVKIHEAVVGLRFVLALAVCWVHIGSSNAGTWNQVNYSYDSFSWTNSRGWCIHTPLFFMLGGFLLASGTGAELKGQKDFRKFYCMRILSLHPMYLLSILVCTINFCLRCRPSNYINTFLIDRTPLPGEYFVCQATPLEMSYGGTLTTSIITFVFALQAWPTVIPTSWFLSAYSWFSSVFYFCIALFPFFHGAFFKRRSDVKALWKLTLVWVLIDIVYMGIASAYFGIEDESTKNFVFAGMYLFPPGWLPSFVLGIAFFFLFQHYSNEKSLFGNKRFWAVLNDTVSVVFLTFWLFYGLSDKSLPWFVRGFLNTRQWYAYVSRLLIPFTSFWVWGLANGGGVTAHLFSRRVMVEYLAPASYNMFLFHQPISEWYFLVTRGVWWSYPKQFYWVSPLPTPIYLWEFPMVIFFVTIVSIFMERYVNSLLTGACANFCAWLSKAVFCGSKKNEKTGNYALQSELELVQNVVKSLTKFEVDQNTNLNDAGINSMMSAILVNKLNQRLPRIERRLTSADLRGMETVGDVAEVIRARRSLGFSGNSTSSTESENDIACVVLDV